MDIPRDVQLDVVFKRYESHSSTSVNKNFFEEVEAPESRYPVFNHLQLYSQADQIPFDVPSDLQNLTDSAMDDAGNSLSGSFRGKTSQYAPVVRRYIQLPLVAVPSPCGQAFFAARCITLSTASPFSAGDIVTGQSSGMKARVVMISGAYVFYRSYFGNSRDFSLGEKIVKSTDASVSSIVVQDASTCPYNIVTRNMISTDVGRGGYCINLYRSGDGSQIRFGEGQWLVDTYSGVVTFYGKLPYGVSGISPPMMSFYRYVGKIGLNTTHTVDGKVGIGCSDPAVSLQICANDAVGLPSGPTSARPNPAQQGYIRFNTDTNTYEGFDGCCWQDLEKGIGSGSDPVDIGTGGLSRAITVGNSLGSTSVDVVSGSGNISLSSGAGLSIQANSNIDLNTTAPAGSPSTITVGSSRDNQTIRLVASGSNSQIELIGPVEFNNPAGVTLASFGPLEFGNSGDGDWRIVEFPTPYDTSTTSLYVQKRIAGSYTTRFRWD